MSTDLPLQQCHDSLLVDLDGVVYLGHEPIPGAADALRAASAAGAPAVFVTNNAARPPGEVAAQLVSMGVEATDADVMTSATAAARILADRYPAGTPILVVGGVGVRYALESFGLRPVSVAAEAPRAILQGFAPEVGWEALAEATVALRSGAAWLATNGDLTLPSPRGPLPGNGSLVSAITSATGEVPEIIGKPKPALFDAAVAASGGRRPLVVGDRLDTDIAGANAAGLPSLLVLTGVSGPADLLAAAPDSRPSYVGRDLASLALAQPGDDGLDPLRDLCRQAWTGSLTPERHAEAVYDLHLDLR